MHLQSKAAADQPTKTPHAHDADGNLICDLLSDKAAYRFEHDSYEHCVAKHARWARATADDDSEEVLTGAPIEVLVAAYVTRRRNDGSKENARDLEKQNSAWKSTAGSGRPDQTLTFSSSVNSKSIRLIFGRIDCSRRVLEAPPKSLVQTVR